MRVLPGDWLLTRSHDRAPAIVVGIDGSARSLAAARWAAAEAEGRGLPLRLVCAVDPGDAGVACVSQNEIHRSAETLVKTVRKQLHQVHGDLQIAGTVVSGTPAQALAGRPGPVAMLCVGASMPAPPHPGHHASTVTEIILSSDSPVVVVTTDPPARGWVVTEINNEPTADDMLRLAVEEALLRRVPLRILIGAHTADGAGGDRRAELHDRTERSLGRWREFQHELEALVVCTEWGLDQFLRRYHSNIALFVAPPRQLYDIGTILHPTAETALRLLNCPVMLYADAVGITSVPTTSRRHSV